MKALSTQATLLYYLFIIVTAKRVGKVGRSKIKGKVPKCNDGARAWWTFSFPTEEASKGGLYLTLLKLHYSKFHWNNLLARLYIFVDVFQALQIVD